MQRKNPLLFFLHLQVSPYIFLMQFLNSTKKKKKMANTKLSNLHVVMFPWFATGHMTPFLHISNELAARGHQITFLLPNKALPHLEHLNLHPHLISFHILTVPHVSGLPPGTETATEIPISLTPLLATAFDLTRPQVTEIIRSASPNLVLYDFAHWVPEITMPLRIRSINYTVVSAASIAITIFPGRTVTVDNPFTEEELREPPPGYPSSTVVLHGCREARSLLFLSIPFGDGITFHERLMASYTKSDAIAMRTCEEIEGDFCSYLAKQFQKKLLLTGPLMADPNKTTTSFLEEKWEKWLSQFEPKTVIFCAFGSQLKLEKEQFEELVLGIEQTGLPFLVAVKPPVGFDSIEEALPKGFEERVRERGVVYGGWIQQPLILKHSSIGCFVSHCGFGSMWESLMSDSQIVLIPSLGDQILNTRLLAQELKVGVEVKREEDGRFTRHSVSQAIESVMMMGETNTNGSGVAIAEMVKKNHAKWKEILTKPGFMDGYIDKFIKNLQDGWS